MKLLNKILAHQTDDFFFVKMQRKIMRMFAVYYVPTNIMKLSESKYTTNSHLGMTEQRLNYQEKIIQKFNSTNSLAHFNSFPKMAEMLKMLFIDKNLKFNFLDFGGESMEAHQALLLVGTKL